MKFFTERLKWCFCFWKSPALPPTPPRVSPRLKFVDDDMETISLTSSASSSNANLYGTDPFAAPVAQPLVLPLTNSDDSQMEDSSSENSCSC